MKSCAFAIFAAAITCVLYSKGYVVEYCVVEEDSFLIHISDDASEILDAVVADIGAVKCDRSFPYVMISWDKVYQSRLA